LRGYIYGTKDEQGNWEIADLKGNVIETGSTHKKTRTIAYLALVAFLLSILPYILGIVVISMPEHQAKQARDFLQLYWNTGWLIPLFLSVLILLKIKGLQTKKKVFKVAISLALGISILLSCIWAYFCVYLLS